MSKACKMNDSCLIYLHSNAFVENLRDIEKQKDNFASIEVPMNVFS